MRAKRRKATRKHLKRRMRISAYCGFPGISGEEGHYEADGRGKVSKFLKNQSNRKIRRDKELLQNSDYKKKYDYWNKLI